jgi:LuxR family maltose regulon positive regulatory protein
MKLAPRWPGRLDFPVLCLLVQARITAAEGDVVRALALVQEAKRQMRAPQAPWEQDVLEAYEVQLWVAQGNLRAAVNWLQHREPEAAVARFRPSTPFYPWVHEHVDIAPVQVLLAQGRTSGDPAPLHRALALLKRQREKAERVGLAWCHIKALTLQALVNDALSEETRSIAVFAEALTLAQSEGYVRVFADEGEPLAALLAAFLRAARSDGTLRSKQHALVRYVKQLWAVTGTPVNSVVGAPIPYGPDMSQPLLEPLSGRELDVLRLVAAGLSNREIAARLVIEVSTVKSYINSLFSKLEVDSRTQAVARARALGLITD